MPAKRTKQIDPQQFAEEVARARDECLVDALARRRKDLERLKAGYAAEIDRIDRELQYLASQAENHSD